MTDNQRIHFILKSIQDIGLPIGATYLSKKHDIPPATIGRTLAVLEEQGLIKKISNKGRVITDKGRNYLIQEEVRNAKAKNANKLVQLVSKADKNTLLEILQTRKLLEGHTAELACHNAEDSEIDELEHLMLEYLHLIRSGELGSHIDLEIHLTIAKMSRNRTIYQILKIMLTGDNVYTKFSFVSDKLKHIQVKQHDAIIQAIRERSPEKARKSMEMHLEQVIDDLEKYFLDDAE